MKEISWDEGERLILSDKEVAKECEKAEPEFQALRHLIILRKEKSISQKELAKLIDSHQSHIARLETGEVPPSLRALKKYAGGLGYRIELNVSQREKE
jgi:predicted transcriptional regulator